MVQPCSFLILLTAFSAMVMVHGAPLDVRSSKHHDGDDNHPASKAPSDVSKLKTMVNGCTPGVDGMCQPNTQAGVMQDGPPVPPSEGSPTGNSDPAGSAIDGSAPAGSPPTGGPSNGQSNAPDSLTSNPRNGLLGGYGLLGTGISGPFGLLNTGLLRGGSGYPRNSGRPSVY
ncbi:hypothetical protein BCR42DRAFT_494085 [Absidia repens]|uniref:Uncharacterized protein n=1 Tax=Absidia repens TaxID=90262 RepID=A0A1X2I8Q1_9FUNG|nr:hypothetical protein BCR42DRAFT_494085 [Absidia repens]